MSDKFLEELAAAAAQAAGRTRDPLAELWVYIASGTDNYLQVRELAVELRKRSIHFTADWTIEVEAWLKGDVDTSDESVPMASGMHDYVGVQLADVVVCLLPGEPPSYESRALGSHVELGMALAWRKPVVLWQLHGEWNKDMPFYWLPQVKQRHVGTSMAGLARSIDEGLSEGWGWIHR